MGLSLMQIDCGSRAVWWRKVFCIPTEGGVYPVSCDGEKISQWAVLYARARLGSIHCPADSCSVNEAAARTERNRSLRRKATMPVRRPVQAVYDVPLPSLILGSTEDLVELTESCYTRMVD